MSVSCFICQEALSLCSEEISVLNCGHLYHKRCLQLWMNDNSTCPECKFPFTAENFVQTTYPFKIMDENFVSKKLSDDTKCMLKVNSAKNSEKTLSERNVTLESKGLKDFKKCLEENNALKQENLRLKLEIEQLKNTNKEINGLEEQSKEVKINSILKRSFHSEKQEICSSSLFVYLNEITVTY